MKQRTDFVSNSSSTSFALMGATYSLPEIQNAFKTLYPQEYAVVDNAIGSNSNKFIKPTSIYTRGLISVFNAKHGRGIRLTYQMGGETYGDSIACIGLPIDEMKDNETKKEFTDRVRNCLNLIFGEYQTVGFVVDCRPEGS